LTPSLLCADCPAIGKFLEACRRLGHAEVPDYGELLALLGDDAPGVAAAWAPRNVRALAARASVLDGAVANSFARLERDLAAVARPSPPRAAAPDETPRRAARPAATPARPSPPPTPSSWSKTSAPGRSALKKRPRAMSAPEAAARAGSPPPPPPSPPRSEKKLRFDERPNQVWVAAGLGYASAVGAAAASPDAAVREECDDVVARWQNRLLKSPPASPRCGKSPRGSPREARLADTLARLLPHLRSAKRFPRAAGVLAKILRKASFAPEGRTAADRARDAAEKLGDAGALRDALAVALNGGRAEFLHGRATRDAMTTLLDAAQARLGDLPPAAARDVALWTLAGSYNAYLGTAADLRTAPPPDDVAPVVQRLRLSLDALEAAPPANRLAEDRRLDAPAALALSPQLFATRGFDVLVRLAEGYRADPRDDVRHCLGVARTALSDHLNPIQKRKLDTAFSTIAATRARADVPGN